VREGVTAVPAVDRLEHRRDACVTLFAAARSSGLGCLVTPFQISVVFFLRLAVILGVCRIVG
jgi:hypothetical protein